MHSLFKGAFNNLRFQLEACMNINQWPKCFKKAKDSIKEHDCRFLGWSYFYSPKQKLSKKVVALVSLIFHKSCLPKAVTCISTLLVGQTKNKVFHCDVLCKVTSVPKKSLPSAVVIQYYAW